MLARYDDIRRRITDEPEWFDKNGVPRYDSFRPDDTPNIYATEAALVEIQCQLCKRKALVAFDWCLSPFNFDRPSLQDKARAALEEGKFYGAMHYGDPPIHGCTGDTMNSEGLRIVEFWRKGQKQREPDFFKWVRVPELEGSISHAEEGE